RLHFSFKGPSGSCWGLRNFRIASHKTGVVPCRKLGKAFTVTIYFVETESAEQEYFSAQLSAHDVRFVAQLDEVGEDAEVISLFINSRVTSEFLAAHPRLRFIATRSTAVDHLDMPACHERKVAVANVAD